MKTLLGDRDGSCARNGQPPRSAALRNRLGIDRSQFHLRRAETGMLSCLKWRAGISAPPGHRGQGCWLRQVHAGDLDDGLPRGFLAGAIVKVWLALHLDWA